MSDQTCAEANMLAAFPLTTALTEVNEPDFSSRTFFNGCEVRA